MYVSQCVCWCMCMCACVHACCRVKIYMQRVRKDMENWIKLRRFVCACVLLSSSWSWSFGEEKLYSKMYAARVRKDMGNWTKLGLFCLCFCFLLVF